MLTRHIEERLRDLFYFLHSFTREEEMMFFENSSYFQYPADKIIMKEGFTCNNVAFLLHGSIRVEGLSEDGREITLYRIREGEICLLTISCIMNNSPFLGLAVVEEEAEMVALPSQIFQKLMLKNQKFQEYIFQRVFMHLKDVMLTVERLAFESVEGRIAGFLYQLYLDQGMKTLSLTHAEIAREIGSAREVVSRRLKKLEEKEILLLTRGKVLLLDVDSLKSRAYVI